MCRVDDGKPMKITESLFECNRGALTIRGTEYRPEGSTLPAAIVSHGIMASQDAVRHYARELAEQGYCAYCFDFCGGGIPGSGKSDGETSDMSVLTELQDLEAVISYVQGRPHVDKKLLLMGCSQGGFVSALAAAKHPGLVDKLVLFYPALCIPDDARAGRMVFARFDPDNIPEMIPCGPMTLGKCYPEAVLRMDPYAQIKAYGGPVLIVHGECDRLVRVEYSKEAQRTYSDAELHIIEGADHVFNPEQDVVAMEYLRRFCTLTE